MHSRIQGWHYCLFAVNLEGCTQSCNTLNDLSNEVCVPNKTGGLNLSISTLLQK